MHPLLPSTQLNPAPHARRSNSMQLAQRLAIMSTDTSKKQFLDWLSTRTYGQGLSECERAMPDDWAEVGALPQSG